MELEPHIMPTAGISAAENSEAIPGYTLRERIGVGGMGAVYRATQYATGSEVAVKVMSPASASDPFYRQMFRDEALMLARLNHPNIVHAHDFGITSDGSLYLAMELVEGKTLKERLRENSLSPRQKVNLIEQICDALAYLHSERVIHRDVKPTNLVVSDDGTVKLVDFGLSGHLQPGQTGIINEDHCPIFGSPMYCAPEQFSEETEVDFRCDIYSLGVVMHELFAGSLPGSMFICQEKRISRGCPFRDLLLKALEYEARDRQPSIAEFRREFRMAIWRASRPTATLSKNSRKRIRHSNNALIKRVPRRNNTPVRSARRHKRTSYLRMSVAAASAVALVTILVTALSMLSVEDTRNRERDASNTAPTSRMELASNLATSGPTELDLIFTQ